MSFWKSKNVNENKTHNLNSIFPIYPPDQCEFLQANSSLTFLPIVKEYRFSNWGQINLAIHQVCGIVSKYCLSLSQWDRIIISYLTVKCGHVVYKTLLWGRIIHRCPGEFRMASEMRMSQLLVAMSVFPSAMILVRAQIMNDLSA